MNTQNPLTYLYDATAMEALYAELAADPYTYYTPTWSTQYVRDVEADKWVYVENEKHDTFECGEVTFQWYHGHNMNFPEKPRLVAAWTTSHRFDDWDEHEEVIDATVEEIHRVTSAVAGSDYPSSDGPYDTIEEARGEA
jgi:hypothetical protein